MYTYIVNDADERQRRREDVDVRDLAPQDDGLRTGDVQVEGVHCCARSRRYLHISRRNGVEK